MAAYCKRCQLHIPDGIASCRMCGSSVLTAPPLPADNSTLLTEPREAADPGFSKWLFVVGLSLLAAPVLSIYDVATVQIPRLSSESGQMLLLEHPGLDQMTWFEISMNGLLALAALVLSILFFTRSKYFPKSMVVYLAGMFVFRLAVAGMTHSLYPNEVMTHAAYVLVRYLAWSAGLAGYLLLNSDVGIHFKN